MARVIAIRSQKPVFMVPRERNNRPRSRMPEFQNPSNAALAVRASIDIVAQENRAILR